VPSASCGTRRVPAASPDGERLHRKCPRKHPNDGDGGPRRGRRASASRRRLSSLGVEPVRCRRCTSQGSSAPTIPSALPLRSPSQNAPRSPRPSASTVSRFSPRRSRMTTVGWSSSPRRYYLTKCREGKRRGVVTLLPQARRGIACPNECHTAPDARPPGRVSGARLPTRRARGTRAPARVVTR
jgi:hypothetical protein